VERGEYFCFLSRCATTCRNRIGLSIAFCNYRASGRTRLLLSTQEINCDLCSLDVSDRKMYMICNLCTPVKHTFWADMELCLVGASALDSDGENTKAN
jgi:hypothetical protein